jgi:hypothetical protein
MSGVGGGESFSCVVFHRKFGHRRFLMRHKSQLHRNESNANRDVLFPPIVGAAIQQSSSSEDEDKADADLG